MIFSMLVVCYLKKCYGMCIVVKDVLFDVKSGEVVGLLGFNGVGKMILFYMIVGLVVFDVGDIVFDGEYISCLLIY